MLKIRGFNLIELLIACALGTLVVSFATRHIAILQHEYVKLQHAIALEDEIDTLQKLIYQHLSKADYVKPDVSRLTSQHATNQTSIQFGHYKTEKPNSCILFSFDRNKNGSVNASENEHMGYRLHEGAIEYRVSGKACDQSGWHDLTDPNTTVVHSFHIELHKESALGKVYKLNLDASSKFHNSINVERQFMVSVLNVR